jgi:hypothetical protein
VQNKCLRLFSRRDKLEFNPREIKLRAKGRVSGGGKEGGRETGIMAGPRVDVTLEIARPILVLTSSLSPRWRIKQCEVNGDNPWSRKFALWSAYD